MEAEQKDYAFKNEISLSIGEDSADSSASTATPSSGPTPSPRSVNEDTKPLTDSASSKKKEAEMSGIDNKAFESNDKTATPGKQMSSFGNGHVGDSSANKNGQFTDMKLAGETFLRSHVIQHSIHAFLIVFKILNILLFNDHLFSLQKLLI